MLNASAPEILSALAGVAGTFATVWFGHLRPSRKARRAVVERTVAEQRALHVAMFGTAEKTDDSGAVITHAQPGLLAKVASASILNGKGDQLIKDVAEIKKEQAAATAAWRQHLASEETAHAAIWTAILDKVPVPNDQVVQLANRLGLSSKPESGAKNT